MIPFKFVVVVDRFAFCSAKLLLLVRDPVARAYSHFNMTYVACFAFGENLSLLKEDFRTIHLMCLTRPFGDFFNYFPLLAAIPSECLLLRKFGVRMF